MTFIRMSNTVYSAFMQLTSLKPTSTQIDSFVEFIIMYLLGLRIN